MCIYVEKRILCVDASWESLGGDKNGVYKELFLIAFVGYDCDARPRLEASISKVGQR